MPAAGFNRLAAFTAIMTAVHRVGEFMGVLALMWKAYDAFIAFRSGIKPWTDASEPAYLNARG